MVNLLTDHGKRFDALVRRDGNVKLNCGCTVIVRDGEVTKVEDECPDVKATPVDDDWQDAMEEHFVTQIPPSRYVEAFGPDVRIGKSRFFAIAGETCHNVDCRCASVVLCRKDGANILTLYVAKDGEICTLAEGHASCGRPNLERLGFTVDDITWEGRRNDK